MYSTIFIKFKNSISAKTLNTQYQVQKWRCDDLGMVCRHTTKAGVIETWQMVGQTRNMEDNFQGLVFHAVLLGPPAQFPTLVLQLEGRIVSSGVSSTRGAN